MVNSSPFLLAVALDGAGWHPAAWRDAGARPGELFDPTYWCDLVREAQRGLLDFVTLDDALALQSMRRGVADERTDQVRGRLDAVLVAARVAPVTAGIGIIPTVTTTHTEPFHVAKSIATLDYVSTGRAGVQVRVSGTSLEAQLFGRRIVQARTVPPRAELSAVDPAVADLFDEAADFVEVIRRLWDSWEDDAEIRDVATGRFVDRHKLHYIDFEGRWFNVRGPSITPRPPQGQPLVTALAHIPVVYRLAARVADLVFVTPHDPGQVRSIETEVRAEEAAVRRDGVPLRVVADLVVFLDDQPGRAAQRKAHLDELDGRAWRSDAFIFTGTPGELVEMLVEWHDAGMAGFRLRPGVAPHDLEAISRGVVPRLVERGLRPERYEHPDLRGRMGLERPINRYATGGSR